MRNTSPTLGPCAIWDICLKRILNSNLANSCLPKAYFTVIQSFWHFAQSMAAILPCSVQNFEIVGQLTQMLWVNEISWDLSLRKDIAQHPCSPTGSPQLRYVRTRPLPSAYARVLACMNVPLGSFPALRDSKVKLWGFSLHCLQVFHPLIKNSLHVPVISSWLCGVWSLSFRDIVLLKSLLGRVLASIIASLITEDFMANGHYNYFINLLEADKITRYHEFLAKPLVLGWCFKPCFTHPAGLHDHSVQY